MTGWTRDAGVSHEVCFNKMDNWMDYGVMLHMIEYLLFGRQPVFKGTAILSAMLLIQSVGAFRDARMDTGEIFIRPVGHTVPVAP